MFAIQTSPPPHIWSGGGGSLHDPKASPHPIPHLPASIPPPAPNTPQPHAWHHPPGAPPTSPHPCDPPATLGAQGGDGGGRGGRWRPSAGAAHGCGRQSRGLPPNPPPPPDPGTAAPARGPPPPAWGVPVPPPSPTDPRPRTRRWGVGGGRYGHACRPSRVQSALHTRGWRSEGGCGGWGGMCVGARGGADTRTVHGHAQLAARLHARACYTHACTPVHALPPPPPPPIMLTLACKPTGTRLGRAHPRALPPPPKSPFAHPQPLPHACSPVGAPPARRHAASRRSGRGESRGLGPFKGEGGAPLLWQPPGGGRGFKGTAPRACAHALAHPRPRVNTHAQGQSPPPPPPA